VLAERRRLCAAVVVTCCALGTAACGGGEQAAAPAAPHAATDLAPVKAFLLDHTERLQRATVALREGAEQYHALAEALDFDYAKLLTSKRADVQAFVKSAQDGFAKANPAYEADGGCGRRRPVAGRLRRDHRRRR
jgi:hypothetical protein